MTRLPSYLRSSALTGLSSLLLASPSSADPGAICLGAVGGSATVAAEEPVVFRNAAPRATRIRFEDTPSQEPRCRLDGRAIAPSWSNQYRLRPGESLSCRMAPGTYRYTAVTPASRGISKERGEVEVRGLR